MKRRNVRGSSAAVRVSPAGGAELMRAIRARMADPDRKPLDLDVSFVPSPADVRRVRELRRLRDDA